VLKADYFLISSITLPPNLLPLGLCCPELLQIAPPLEKVVEGSASIVILGTIPKFASTN
jgi:hypothetical protein